MTTMESVAAEALLAQATRVGDAGPGRGALPGPVAWFAAAWQIDGGIAVDAVIGRGRLAAGVGGAMEHLRSGDWDAFRATSPAPAAGDGPDGPLPPPRRAWRASVAALGDADRIAYRAVVAGCAPRRGERRGPERPTAAAMRALGAACVARALRCPALARALLAFGERALSDWDEALDHAVAERLASPDHGILA